MQSLHPKKSSVESFSLWKNTNILKRLGRFYSPYFRISLILTWILPIWIKSILMETAEYYISEIREKLNEITMNIKDRNEELYQENVMKATRALSSLKDEIKRLKQDPSN